MTQLRRWIRSTRIAGLVGGVCLASGVLAQELPKLPGAPVIPPAVPTAPVLPSPPTPPTIPPLASPVMPPAQPTVPPVVPESKADKPLLPAGKPPQTKADKPTVPPIPSETKEDKPTTSPLPPLSTPGYIPPADSDPSTAVPPKPPVAKVTPGTSQDGTTSLPQALAAAREAHSKLRDYAGFLVRQERVQGKLLPEQTCELRVRTNPMSVSVKVLSPKTVSGQDTVYNPSRWTKVKHMASGVDGIRLGYQSLSIDDPKVLIATRHPLTNVGLLAILDRVDKAIATEKQLNHPVQILQSDYTFLNRPCTRYDIFADKPHPGRYAQRMVLYLDKETSLPVRFEAYDADKISRGDYDLIESTSFVSLKFNVGLGDKTFDR